MSFDVQLFHLLNDTVGKSNLYDWAVVFLASYLPYLVVVAFLVLVYASKNATRQKLEFFWVTIFSTVVAMGITETIRFFYHRVRPFLAFPDTHHLLTDTAWSFPSAHSTFFFAMATAVCFYNKKWGIAFFAAAILITICRVIAGVHYPLDILGGAVVGIGAALGVHTFAVKKRFIGGSEEVIATH